MIGDLQTAALVERGGSIDWLCFPRFDSGACFAALLGEPENGRWLLAPTAGGTTSRSLSRRDPHPGDDVGERRGRGARVRLHAPAWKGAGRRSHRRGHPRQGRDALRARHPLRLRPHRAVGTARRPRARRRRRARRPVLPHSCTHPRREHAHGLDVHGGGGRARSVRAHVVSVPRGSSGRDRSGTGVHRDGRVLARMGRRLQVPTSPTSGGTCSSVRSSCSRRSSTSRPAGSSPRRRPRCPNGSAACGTGTTGTAGCATRR